MLGFVAFREDLNTREKPYEGALLIGKDGSITSLMYRVVCSQGLLRDRSSLCLIFILAFAFSCRSGLAKKMVPNKVAWLDLRSKGILFVTTAVLACDLGRSKPNIKYGIRRKDGFVKPEKLVPKKGLFSFSLKPGVYEFYDWSLSGLKSHESQGRYEFEVKAGFLTYIRQIVTGVNLMQNEAGKKVLKDLPFVSDSMLGKSDSGLLKGSWRSPNTHRLGYFVGSRRSPATLFRQIVLKDSLIG